MPSLSSCSRLCALGVLVLVGPGCFTKECDYRSQCVGPGQYEWCNTGSDFETRRVVSDCATPNLACVNVSEDTTRCVHAPATRCDASFEDRCEGTWRVYCDEGFGWVQAVDCVALGRTGCGVDAASGKTVCD
jgi:hypothetical protein